MQNKYKFQTKQEAADYVAKIKAKKTPGEELFISGPYFVDQKETYKDMPWLAHLDEQYWEVSVREYR